MDKKALERIIHLPIYAQDFSFGSKAFDIKAPEHVVTQLKKNSNRR